ncbi:toxin-activating lysine-acyltransferase, partial [Escherichia coli]|nr:toxin-activating lysine-acyltransferase [Escherichia coli]
MRNGKYDVLSPLYSGEPVNEAEVLGAAVWLWMHSPLHRDAPLHTLPDLLL